MDKRLLFRLVLGAALISLISAFWIFDLGGYLTLSYIKDTQRHFEALYAARPLSVIAGYMAIYIIVTSLSLPGAAVMSLAGGAIFGLWVGTVVISFASSIGATLACIVSRFLLRDWVQARLGERLRTVNKGFLREGAFYLFALRLIPVFPFWMINLAMGLTKMRLGTFYWVSQTGMLAGTIVYVNAGRELGRIESVSGILSARLILSFALLGIFPVAAKKMLSSFRARNAKIKS
ncbi:MAG: TVP38/TMEM64 family protein [Nitrospirae bacterium]|nr:TVP38/TMEM64 family protein [Nitrospirota bacterium]